VLYCYILAFQILQEQKAEKGYPCDICGKLLNHPSSVVYHKEAEHNNGRRFVCNKCGKGFKHKQLLQRHQLVHSEDRYASFLHIIDFCYALIANEMVGFIVLV
jgi:uncharacterized Zn-finger protein